MIRPELPPDLRRFILTSIPSVPFLEAVLLLRGERAAPWSASAMARRLYVAEPAAQALLDSAVAAGFAEVTETPEGRRFAYRPTSTDFQAVLDRLAAHYARDVVSVTDLIHSRVDKRAQQFADAFRWRKDS